MKQFKRVVTAVVCETMTVGELIYVLRNYPKDLPVVGGLDGRLGILSTFDFRVKEVGFPGDMNRGLVIDFDEVPELELEG